MPQSAEAGRMNAMASAAAAAPFLSPLRFDDLLGFAADDHCEAFAVFAQHAAAIVAHACELRPARPASDALVGVCRRALAQAPPTDAAARRFFEENFAPFRVASPPNARGFVTGYYEPILFGSSTRTKDFTAPILARPDDLVTVAPDEQLPGVPPGTSAVRRMPDGSYAAYPERAAIEAGAIAAHTKPLVWLADPVEVFFVQVQGCALVRLSDGSELRLTYAGRNGRPYSSIGRMLVEAGEISPEDLGLERVKAWIRAHGQGPSEPGGAFMLRNKSYVFFSQKTGFAFDEGPIGGAGLPLSPLRSIAIDCSLWPYGLPFWLSGDLPWQNEVPTPFQRLMIAGDTGSAIVGPARADIFFGSGGEAGLRAGEIRHACDIVVLLPRATPGEAGA